MHDCHGHLPICQICLQYFNRGLLLACVKYYAFMTFFLSCTGWLVVLCVGRKGVINSMDIPLSTKLAYESRVGTRYESEVDGMDFPNVQSEDDMFAESECDVSSTVSPAKLPCVDNKNALSSTESVSLQNHEFKHLSSMDMQSSVSTSRVLYEVIWPVSSICTTPGCYQVYAHMRKNLVYIQ